ncbi:VirD4-like conjugal transfer protein, CD1115 family [Lactobacillus sp. A27]|uniref:VirD4-like conjugal transfer protein, CD1115 family n=1 Tax=Lactobacillus sp. A27 TaxID=2796363 RepID=UPI00191FD086|nr:type IV secretory system conjugative DNA transfer family protein [Lactobacillus sp. A27]MBL1060817.1 type IV secretory system conjugative DNA transfer family protein [Lactobacillus sp. A27]
MATIGFMSNSTDDEKEKTPWTTKLDKNSVIFGKHTFLPMNLNEALNDNTLVIGTSGTGKTYSFVEPNVLQGNANYVIADAKGAILNNVGQSLKKQGYHLQVLNLIDLKHSMSYNPLHYLKTDLDITNFANQVIATDPTGFRSHGNNFDPFWDNAARAVLEVLILFVKENLPEEEQTIGTITRLFSIINLTPDHIDNALSIFGDNEKGFYFSDYTGSDNSQDTVGSKLFDWLRENHPDSEALKKWDHATQSRGSNRTWSSICGVLGAYLSIYDYPDVENLLSSNQINFEALLKPKTAFFILYDDADPSKNFISNVLYGQMISFLYHKAFELEDNRLPVKVRFFLDDFKNVLIPHFDDYLATARSRNISFCMMLQDESQLQTKFGPNTSSVIGNCSSYLLTGTTDLNMARIAAERFNRRPTSIRLMDNDNFLLDVGGYLTETTRYDYMKHPNYVNKKFPISFHIHTPQLHLKWSKMSAILKHLPSEYNNDEDDDWLDEGNTVIDVSSDDLPF